jgi:hypothetical protein
VAEGSRLHHANRATTRYRPPGGITAFQLDLKRASERRIDSRVFRKCISGLPLLRTAGFPVDLLRDKRGTGKYHPVSCMALSWGQNRYGSHHSWPWIFGSWRHRLERRTGTDWGSFTFARRSGSRGTRPPRPTVRGRDLRRVRLYRFINVQMPVSSLSATANRFRALILSISRPL